VKPGQEIEIIQAPPCLVSCACFLDSRSNFFFLIHTETPHLIVYLIEKHFAKYLENPILSQSQMVVLVSDGAYLIYKVHNIKDHQ
jgi:hypothetical protein